MEYDWYRTSPSYPGPELSTPHSTSPQSSNGSLLCTPYQPDGSITEIGPRDSPFGYTRLDAAPMTQPGSTGPIIGLGLQVPEPRKASPLGGLYESASRGFNDFNTVPLNYARGPQNHDMVWHDPSTGYASGAGSSYDDFYSRIPARSHSNIHTRSSSDIGAGTLTSSSLHFPPQGSPFTVNRDPPSMMSRSSSLPPPVPGDYAPFPPGPNWNGSQYNCLAPNYHNGTMLARPIDGNFSQGSSHQWVSPVPTYEEPGPTSPTNEADGSPLFQSRVGSDRTRAISRSRRSNPDKKLYHCQIPGCGATITSRHNYKSHCNSHYGIKPHACGQGACDRNFGTLAEVKRHRLRHCQYRS